MDHVKFLCRLKEPSISLPTNFFGDKLLLTHHKLYPQKRSKHNLTLISLIQHIILDNMRNMCVDMDMYTYKLTSLP